MNIFNIEQFISENITGRNTSLFKDDIEANASLLSERIKDKSVLVIGGAGTIGSSFVKAVLKFSPAELYVIDINENGLTELVREVRSNAGLKAPDKFLTYPINFADPIFEKILRNHGAFDIVANFAAHKHVRSEKDHYSIEAMIDNNVFKAKKLLDLLLQFPPKHFFCVSTDKAANPVNIMGASKKLMEEVIMAYSSLIPITTARFANVAFSNGSLLYGFLERLMKRQPLSAPNDVKRYFVSPEESGELCMLACILGSTGDIFFPKLSESSMRTFSSIANDFLKVHHMQPDLCNTEEEAKTKARSFNTTNSSYPVYYFSSDTSGEKSYEEFFTDKEELDLKTFKNLGVIKNSEKKPVSTIEKMITELTYILHNPATDKKAIVNAMKAFMPNFEHIETGINLDQKM